MMRVVQFDIDELLCGDEERLSEIKEFDPYAVLEYVDGLKGFAKKDVMYVRGVWVKLMCSGVIRVVNGKRVISGDGSQIDKGKS